MANVTSNNDRKSFAIKNPTNGKIIGFINASQFTDANLWDSLSGADLKTIINQCAVEEFVKSDNSTDAFAGLSLSK